MAGFIIDGLKNESMFVILIFISWWVFLMSRSQCTQTSITIPNQKENESGSSDILHIEGKVLGCFFLKLGIINPEQ